jgi:signal transduction histidine kinase
MNRVALRARASERRNALGRLAASIGTKIVLPYLLLTLAVAGVGAYVVTNLVTSSLKERFDNQLLDAGRVVSESMVQYETDRLEVLRYVTGTQGVSEHLAAAGRDELAGLVPQIAANHNMAAVKLLDVDGTVIYGWYRRPGQGPESGQAEPPGADYSEVAEVRRVLRGEVDALGDKHVLVADEPLGQVIFTIGPVYRGEELVGAAMVGTYLQEMVAGLAESAVARVTLYDPEGNGLVTTLGRGQEGVAQDLKEPSQQYETITALLHEPENRHQFVVARAGDQVLLRQVNIMGQEYQLAYGEWRLRDQSFGLFSVALPSNFVVTTAGASRNILSLVFSVATMAVISIGFLIARRIINPLNRLVETSLAVASGDLEQRTGIRRGDEIGSLASSFDIMTDKLRARNRELMEQASKLTAILDSIADGVIVLDTQRRIITSNPAAQQVLNDMAGGVSLGPSGALPSVIEEVEVMLVLDQLAGPDMLHAAQRFHVGERVLSALAAPVLTPDGEELGTVIVLRDITREVESEQLKDQFITNISHELRTPLTAIKGYSDLLLMTADDGLDRRRMEFVRTIGDNANQLLRHINELIDISQIQGRSLGLERERLNFSRLVEELAEKWREPMAEKELGLRVRLSGGSLWVEGDHSRLTWALDNLLSNANHYTLPGGRVEVRVFSEDNQARVDVVDTGVGVAESDQPYLFTRFFRARNEDTFGVRGVGLGLYITRSLVELHGGRVWAASEPGVGSTFSIAIPLIADGGSA